MPSPNDSSGNIAAARPGQEMAALIAGMNKVYQVLGGLESKVEGLTQRLADHRNSRDRDDDAIRSELNAMKVFIEGAAREQNRTIDEQEKKLNALELSLARDIATKLEVSAMREAVERLEKVQARWVGIAVGMGLVGGIAWKGVEALLSVHR